MCAQLKSSYLEIMVGRHDDRLNVGVPASMFTWVRGYFRLKCLNARLRCVNVAIRINLNLKSKQL